MLLALLFTSSVPAWAILLTSALVTLLAMSVATRWRLATRATVALLVIALAMAPLCIAYPGILSALTGRSTADLALTTDFRTQTWERVIEIWAERPAIGYGPGQSSVQLTIEAAGDDAPGLLSAHGIWAAALIDAGALGAACWLLFLGGALGVGMRCLLRRPSLLRAAAAAAALAAVLSALIAGDRLDLRVWILLAAFTAVSLPAAAPRADPSK
jgi:O-antigen ligase